MRVDKIVARLALVAFPTSLDTVKSILLDSQLEEPLCDEPVSLVANWGVVSVLLDRKWPCLEKVHTSYFINSKQSYLIQKQQMNMYLFPLI